MRQGLNVLPVRHEYAPGEEPSLIESAVAFFGYEWRMEQYLVMAGLVGIAVVFGLYMKPSKRTRRPDRAAPSARVDAVLGASMRSLRQERMPGGVSGGGFGVGKNSEAPNIGAGRLAARAPDKASLRA